MKRASPDALQKALAGSAKGKKVDAPSNVDVDIGGERPGRSGQRIVGAWFDKKVSLQFQRLVLERTEQTGERHVLRDLIREAYNDLFIKYGKLPIA